MAYSILDNLVKKSTGKYRLTSSEYTPRIEEGFNGSVTVHKEFSEHTQQEPIEIGVVYKMRYWVGEDDDLELAGKIAKHNMAKAIYGELIDDIHAARELIYSGDKGMAIRKLDDIVARLK